MSLRKKIFMLLAVIVLIIYGMNAVSFYRSYVEMNKVVNSAGLSFIKRTAFMIDTFFRQYRAMARDVGLLYATLDESGVFVDDAGRVDDRGFARHLARFLEENKPFGVANAFIVGERTGYVVDGTGWQSGGKTDYRQTAWYKEGMAGGEVVLGNPYHDPITKQGVFNVMYRVEAKDGTPLALLGIVIGLADVRELVREQHLSDSIEGAPLFIDDKGALWSDLPWIPVSESGQKWGITNITQSSDVIPEALAFWGAKMARREEGWGDFSAQGQNWRLFYAPSLSTHLIVGYLLPRSLFYTQVEQLVLFSFISAFVALTLILLILIPVSRSLEYTVKKIENTAQVIKATFAPFKAGDSLETGEEFFREERFDRMTKSLQLLMDDIQEQLRNTPFLEFREILGGIHSTLRVVAEQQADLTAHAQEIMAMNSDISNINAQLHRREIMWSGLLEISQSITSTLNFHIALERVVDSVKNVTQAYGVAILTLEENELVPLFFSGYPNSKRDAKQLHMTLDAPSLCARAVITHVVQWAEDVAQDPEYLEFDSRVRSEVAIPLYQSAQALGVMLLSFEKRYHRNDEFLSMLNPVGASISGHLYIWKAHKEIRSSYEYLMLKFQEIADIYHHETASHLVRVGRYSALAAAWMGCPLQDQQDILIFSRAHDLGKIRVPVEIVVKPSGLTLEEFEIMKQHTVWGAELIGDAVWLRMARNICLTHHERWNGTGYPQALRGEEIPLEGRIVSLVDIYDALRSPRSYKEGYTHEESVTIILEGDGRTLPEHFDPTLWEFFKHNHLEMARIFDEIGNG